MFGHSAFGEYTFGSTPTSVYNLPNKFFEFAVANTSAHAFANQRNRAFGSYGSFLTSSSNAITSTSPFVAFANGVWVRVIDNSTNVYTSTDAVTWTLRTGALPGTFLQAYVAGNGSLFVAYGGSSSTKYYSTNGVNWSTASTPGSYGFSHMVYTVAGYFLGLNSNNQTSISYDGNVWTDQTHVQFGVSGLITGVGDTGTGTYIIGQSGASAILYMSALGATAANVTTAWRCSGIASTASIIVLSCKSTTDTAVNYCKTAASPQSTDAGYTTRTLPYTRIWGRVSWNGTHFVIPSTTDGVICYSTDGITWEGRDTGITSPAYLYSSGNTSGKTVFFSNAASTPTVILSTGYTASGLSITETVAQSYDVSVALGVRLNLDTGWIATSGVIEDSGAGLSWTGLTNVQTSDDTYASISLAGFDIAKNLIFSFAPGVPNNATITGLQISTEGKVSSPPLLVDFIFLSDNDGVTGISGSDIYATGFGTTESTTVSPPTPTMWGLSSSTLTPAFLNGANFRVVLQLRANSATTIDIDQVRIRTLYSVPATSISFSSASSFAHSFALARNKRVATSIAEIEANSFASPVRNRRVVTTIAQSEVHTIALNVQKAIKDMGTISIAQIETITEQIARARRVTLTQAEIETIATTVSRNRRAAFSVAEVETLNNALRRARNVSMTVTEAEAITESLVRTRRVTSSILEQIVYSILSIGVPYTQLEFSVTEVEALVANVARQRRVSFTQAEVEALAITALARARRVAFPVTQTATYNSAVGRNRGTTLQIGQTETLTGSLNRLRGVTAALAESFGYQFSVQKIKALTATIAELQTHSFGGLRRTRNVLTSLSEVINFAVASSRVRSVGLSVQETELIEEALRRVRSVSSSIAEIEATTVAVSRKRDVLATVSQIEALNISLGKLKLMAYVIAQSENNTFFVNRARRAVVSVNTLEAVQASFNRARTVVLPIPETENFSLDFGRFRQQVLNIAETQGVNAALRRTRELLQSISNSTDLIFNVFVEKGEPARFIIRVQWEEWHVLNTRFGTTLRLVPQEQTIDLNLRPTGVGSVTESASGIATVVEELSADLRLDADFEAFVVVPNNTL